MDRSLRETIDAHSVGRYQIAIIAMIALTAILDGLDLQVVSFAAPLISADWHLNSNQLAPIMAAALIGMAAGSLIGGWLGDRIGRRWSLIASLVVFSLSTIACAFVRDVPEFVVARFIGGLGFGAAFPVGVALVTEWMPRRWLGPVVTAMTIGVPLGGLIGAAITAQVLPVIGWRACFLIFGFASAIYAIILCWKLPESPAYLVQKDRQEAVRDRLARAWGATSQPETVRYRLFEEHAETGSATAFFLRDDLRMSVGLWLAFFFQNIATFAFIGWTPTVLVALGMPLPTSIRGLLVWNLVALAGALGGAFLIKKYGSRSAMFLWSGLGLVGAVAISILIIGFTPQVAMFTPMLFVLLALEGFCVGVLQTGLFVIASNAYETRLKSRGIGTASTFGRLGGISSAFAAGLVLTAGQHQFFVMIACIFSAVFVSQFIVVRHFVPVARAGIGPAEGAPRAPFVGQET